MYAGYAWLTNAVAPNSTTRRTLLLVGMSGFLVMALAIPEAFGDRGWLFGAAYLVVNVVHSLLFAQSSGRVRLPLRRLAAVNVTAALLVLAGGFLPEPFRHIAWLLAPLLQISSRWLIRPAMHRSSAGHFAERHALVMIIAIGESIIAIGLGFRGVELGFGEILVAVLGLCIAYYLWWAYFAGDDERAEHVLSHAADEGVRARLALDAWGYAHFPMLLGVVVAAAGIKKAVGHAFEPLHWGEAIMLSGGVAIYLIGHAAFLRRVGLDGVIHRLVAAAVVLAVIPLGHVLAVAQLAAIPLIMTAAAIVEDVPRMRRSGTTTISNFGRTPTADS